MTQLFVFEGNNTTLREKILWEASLKLEKWVRHVNTETFEWRSKNKSRSLCEEINEEHPWEKEVNEDSHQREQIGTG